MTRAEYLSLLTETITKRMEGADQAMKAAQEAANSEQKSSAGDKYETARAMAQADRDRAARLWAEADDMQAQLMRIAGASSPDGIARVGSILVTNKGVFMLGVGVGKVIDGPPPVFAISMQAPAAKLLAGLKKGDTAKLPAGPAKVLEVL
jgi:hypothetical protein